MHVLGTGVPRRLGVARSGSSPKAAQALGCSLTPGLRITFSQVTCIARAASVPGLWTLGSLLLRGACVSVWVVLGLGFWLRPATPGWGVGVCVRLCVRSAYFPPLLAGVCGGGVGAWVRVLAAPRCSWLGARGLSLLVCVLGLYPSLLAAVCVVGLCASALVSVAPRHSWLGCWSVCVLVCMLRFYPATPGWVVRGGCVCLGSGFGCAPPLLGEVLGCASLCTRSACSPPLLAGGCAVGVCAWARVLAAPHHSWLGCWGVRVRTPLVPRHSWLGCVVWVCLLGLGFLLPPCHSWLGCCGVCVLVCVLCLYPATPGCGVRSRRLRLAPGFCCAPPLLAGSLGCVCARSACTPPLLAGVCCVGVCCLARVSAAPRDSWLGCWGVRVRAQLVLCHSWLGSAALVYVLGLGFRLRHTIPGWSVGVCVCGLCLYPATPGWDV